MLVFIFATIIFGFIATVAYQYNDKVALAISSALFGAGAVLIFAGYMGRVPL